MKLTGQMIANNSRGNVDKASNHFQPNVGMTIRASTTSKHAPNAQKH